MRKILSFLLCLTLFISCLPISNFQANAQNPTPVEKYGKLQIIGSQLCDESGTPVQLRGMSSHGLAWYGEYCNKNVIQWLRDDWNCDIYRAAMYTDEWGGYISNPAVKNKVFEAVDACIDLGMYVIIDWHILFDNNPQIYKAQALEFFDEVSEKYKDCPNVLYEIMNEPNDYVQGEYVQGSKVTWLDDCKPYAEEIIPVIRKNDPDGIILVGGPQWSQLVQDVIDNPLIGFSNIAYTVHLYTNEPQSWWPLNRMTSAMNKGLCVFVSEWGCTDSSGDGSVGEESARIFLDYLDQHKISWVNWNISDKSEASACLVSRPMDRVSVNGGWSEDDLSESGKFIRNELRKTLSNEILVESILLSQNKASIIINETFKLTATVLPENATNKSYSFSTSDDNIISVSQDGTITAKNIGTAKITVTTQEGGKTDYCDITVKKQPFKITNVSISQTDNSFIANYEVEGGTGDCLFTTCLVKNGKLFKADIKSTDSYFTYTSYKSGKFTLLIYCTDANGNKTMAVRNINIDI